MLRIVLKVLLAIFCLHSIIPIKIASAVTDPLGEPRTNVNFKGKRTPEAILASHIERNPYEGNGAVPITIHKANAAFAENVYPLKPSAEVCKAQFKILIDMWAKNPKPGRYAEYYCAVIDKGKVKKIELIYKTAS